MAFVLRRVLRFCLFLNSMKRDRAENSRFLGLIGIHFLLLRSKRKIVSFWKAYTFILMDIGNRNQFIFWSCVVGHFRTRMQQKLGPTNVRTRTQIVSDYFMPLLFFDISEQNRFSIIFSINQTYAMWLHLQFSIFFFQRKQNFSGYKTYIYTEIDFTLRKTFLVWWNIVKYFVHGYLSENEK